MSRIPDPLAFLRGKNFPVYLLPDGKPAAWPKKGNCPHKVIICAIPKAGTYLYARLLELLGLEFTKLHIWLTGVGFSDYRFSSMKEARENYERFNVEMPLRDTVKLIHEGQFAVSHLEHNSETKQLLGKFKVIFVYRNFRDCLVSHMRFLVSAGRDKDRTAPFRVMPDGPDKLLKYMDSYWKSLIDETNRVLGWFDDRDALKVSFEDIVGDSGATAQRSTIKKIAHYLEVPLEEGKLDWTLTSLLWTDTLTWSGSRTSHGLFWNDQVESKFAEIGGHKINIKLGYGPTKPTHSRSDKSEYV